MRKQCQGAGPHRRPHIAWSGTGFSWSIAYLSSPGEGLHWGHCWRLYASPERGPEVNQEEVTSFGKPLATWPAALHPPVSFLPPEPCWGYYPSTGTGSFRISGCSANITHASSRKEALGVRRGHPVFSGPGQHEKAGRISDAEAPGKSHRD